MTSHYDRCLTAGLRACFTCLTLVLAASLLTSCQRTKAWLGDADAQHELGVACKAKNPEAALQWFNKAAAKGNSAAQYELGLAHKVKNPEAALQWFSKAAEKGHAQAQYELGLAYRRGLGVAKNRSTAVRFFQRACDAGVKPACPEAKLRLLVRYKHSIDIALDGAAFLDGMTDSERHHLVEELGQGYQTTLEKVIVMKKAAAPEEEFKESPNLFNFVVDINAHFSEHPKYFFGERLSIGVTEHWGVRDTNDPTSSSERSLQYELEGQPYSIGVDDLHKAGAAAYVSTTKPKRDVVIAPIRQVLAAWSSRP